MENNYLILGIDPGLNFTGWGIVESLSNKENHISHGVIKTTKTFSLGERLNTIYENLNKIIDKYDPKEISVEKIFSNSNPDSTMKLGKARGIVFLVAARKKLKISEYSPNTIKKNLVGYGHADKRQIKKMIERIYPNIEIENEDSADALAVAICHSMQAKSKLNVKGT